MAKFHIREEIKRILADEFAQRRPLPQGRVYHFNVIYNHARCPLSATEDNLKALNWTQKTVEKLQLQGLVNTYYHDRDCPPGLSFLQELDRVISGSEVTVVLLTPGFLRDCWPRYWLLPSFRSLFASGNEDTLAATPGHGSLLTAAADLASPISNAAFESSAHEFSASVGVLPDSSVSSDDGWLSRGNAAEFSSSLFASAHYPSRYVDDEDLAYCRTSSFSPETRLPSGSVRDSCASSSSRSSPFPVSRSRKSAGLNSVFWRTCRGGGEGDRVGRVVVVALGVREGEMPAGVKGREVLFFSEDRGQNSVVWARLQALLLAALPPVDSALSTPHTPPAEPRQQQMPAYEHSLPLASSASAHRDLASVQKGEDISRTKTHSTRRRSHPLHSFKDSLDVTASSNRQGQFTQRHIPHEDVTEFRSGSHQIHRTSKRHLSSLLSLLPTVTSTSPVLIRKRHWTPAERDKSTAVNSTKSMSESTLFHKQPKHKEEKQDDQDSALLRSQLSLRHVSASLVVQPRDQHHMIYTRNGHLSCSQQENCEAERLDYDTQETPSKLRRNESESAAVSNHAQNGQLKSGAGISEDGYTVGNSFHNSSMIPAQDISANSSLDDTQPADVDRLEQAAIRREVPEKSGKTPISEGSTVSSAHAAVPSRHRGDSPRPVKEIPSARQTVLQHGGDGGDALTSSSPVVRKPPSTDLTHGEGDTGEKLRSPSTKQQTDISKHIHVTNLMKSAEENQVTSTQTSESHPQVLPYSQTVSSPSVFGSGVDADGVSSRKHRKDPSVHLSRQKDQNFSAETAEDVAKGKRKRKDAREANQGTDREDMDSWHCFPATTEPHETDACSSVDSVRDISVVDDSKADAISVVSNAADVSCVFHCVTEDSSGVNNTKAPSSVPSHETAVTDSHGDVIFPSGFAPRNQKQSLGNLAGIESPDNETGRQELVKEITETETQQHENQTEKHSPEKESEKASSIECRQLHENEGEKEQTEKNPDRETSEHHTQSRISENKTDCQQHPYLFHTNLSENKAKKQSPEKETKPKSQRNKCGEYPVTNITETQPFQSQSETQSKNVQDPVLTNENQTHLASHEMESKGSLSEMDIEVHVSANENVDQLQKTPVTTLSQEHTTQTLLHENLAKTLPGGRSTETLPHKHSGETLPHCSPDDTWSHGNPEEPQPLYGNPDETGSHGNLTEALPEGYLDETSQTGKREPTLLHKNPTELLNRGNSSETPSREYPAETPPCAMSSETLQNENSVAKLLHISPVEILPHESGSETPPNGYPTQLLPFENTAETLHENTTQMLPHETYTETLPNENSVGAPLRENPIEITPQEDDPRALQHGNRAEGAMNAVPAKTLPQGSSDETLPQENSDEILPHENPLETLPRRNCAEMQTSAVPTATRLHGNSGHTPSREHSDETLLQESSDETLLRENPDETLPLENLPQALSRANLAEALMDAAPAEILLQKSSDKILPHKLFDETLVQENSDKTLPHGNLAEAPKTAVPTETSRFENSDETLPPENPDETLPKENRGQTLPQENPNKTQRKKASEETLPPETPAVAQSHGNPTDTSPGSPVERLLQGNLVETLLRVSHKDETQVTAKQTDTQTTGKWVERKLSETLTETETQTCENQKEMRLFGNQTKIQSSDNKTEVWQPGNQDETQASKSQSEKLLSENQKEVLSSENRRKILSSENQRKTPVSVNETDELTPECQTDTQPSEPETEIQEMQTTNQQPDQNAVSVQNNKDDLGSDIRRQELSTGNSRAELLTAGITYMPNSEAASSKIHSFDQQANCNNCTASCQMDHPMGVSFAVEHVQQVDMEISGKHKHGQELLTPNATLPNVNAAGETVSVRSIETKTDQNEAEREITENVTLDEKLLTEESLERICGSASELRFTEPDALDQLSDTESGEKHFSESSTFVTAPPPEITEPRCERTSHDGLTGGNLSLVENQCEEFPSIFSTDVACDKESEVKRTSDFQHGGLRPEHGVVDPMTTQTDQEGGHRDCHIPSLDDDRSLTDYLSTSCVTSEDGTLSPGTDWGGAANDSGFLSGALFSFGESSPRVSTPRTKTQDCSHQMDEDEIIRQHTSAELEFQIQGHTDEVMFMEGQDQSNTMPAAAVFGLDRNADMALNKTGILYPAASAEIKTLTEMDSPPFLLPENLRSSDSLQVEPPETRRPPSHKKTVHFETEDGTSGSSPERTVSIPAPKGMGDSREEGEHRDHAAREGHSPQAGGAAAVGLPGHPSEAETKEAQSVPSRMLPALFRILCHALSRPETPYF